MKIIRWTMPVAVFLSGCAINLPSNPSFISKSNTNKATVYYVPLLKNRTPNKRNCHNIEGVCKYASGGKDYIYNFTGRRAPGGAAFAKYAAEHHVELSKAVCRSGKARWKTNCTHPCRSLAASLRHHRRGELLFIPELVGVNCGSNKSTIVHDGYVFINDTGAVKHFNKKGRFDFFWGDCNKFTRNAVCADSTSPKIDRILDKTEYRLIWSPHRPQKNKQLMKRVERKIRLEARRRGDGVAATSFSFSDFQKGGKHYARFVSS